MGTSLSHPVYSRDATVYVVSGEEKFETFHRAIEQSGFINHVLDRWRATTKAQDEFRIAIKPNIMTASRHEENSPVYTDPALVEDLIRLLRAEGFSRFTVVETQNVYNYSYTGRTVQAVAEMCGYSGDGYDIVDLNDDTVPLDYGGLLGVHPAGRAWLDADYRVSFAKNKTHWQCFYTASLKCVYGCLPMWDKMKVYHGRGRGGRNIEFFHATVLVNEKMPAHFGFMDAWVSGDGLTGHVRDPHPNETRTIFASENCFALDWVAGEKMQIDPGQNYVLQEAMHRWGTIHITRVGNMTPWVLWDNVRPIVVIGFNVIEEFYWFGRFMSRAAATESDPRFPQVGRFQGFFKVMQAIVRLLEGLLTRATDPKKARRLPV